MGKLRNLYNRSVQKYTNIKAKYTTLKRKIHNNVAYYSEKIKTKLIRLKVDFDYYFGKLIKKLDDLSQQHKVKKVVKLESKIDKVKSKIKNL